MLEKPHWFTFLPESGNPPALQYLLSATVEVEKAKQALASAETRLQESESQIQALAESKWTEEEIEEAKRRAGILPVKVFVHKTTTPKGVPLLGMYVQQTVKGKVSWRLTKFQTIHSSWTTVHGNQKRPVMGLPVVLTEPPSTGTWEEYQGK